MKQGAIVGRDVVMAGKAHHIMAYWNNPVSVFGRSEGDSGRTLCGRWVLIGLGNKWKIVPGGSWKVERDCHHCMHCLVART